jgi:hypothetical protein
MCMTAPLLWRHFTELQSAPMTAITLAAAGSFMGQIAAVVQGAPLWVYVLAAVAPWLPIFVLELSWTYRHYKWVAVFCVLIVSQSAYVFEHAAQMIQIHILGRSTADALGIFGAVDLQRVQFLWSTWALLVMLLLVSRFPRNPWLWLLLVIGAMDATQHLAIFVDSTPIFVSRDMQFVLSAIEFTTLALAFAWQLGRTYDAWLARAFPQLPERVLIETTGRLEELRLRPGERVEQASDRCYIVTRGTGSLVRGGPGGHDILLRMLSPGQIVRGGGTLCAETTLEVLALPAGAVPAAA